MFLPALMIDAKREKRRRRRCASRLFATSRRGVVRSGGVVFARPLFPLSFFPPTPRLHLPFVGIHPLSFILDAFEFTSAVWPCPREPSRRPGVLIYRRARRFALHLEIVDQHYESGTRQRKRVRCLVKGTVPAVSAFVSARIIDCPRGGGFRVSSASRPHPVTRYSVMSKKWVYVRGEIYVNSS